MSEPSSGCVGLLELTNIGVGEVVKIVQNIHTHHNFNYMENFFEMKQHWGRS